MMNRNDVKILAFYLPQFHRIPENDAWWGEGFTDWVNVKKAVPLFAGHQQPREPENDNYYDLADPDVLRQQMRRARENGIYGFCYYHYWFNGKLLLQKPLEQMLHIKEKLPFCFCWANEPWARTWDGQNKNILMPQYYGTETEWETHFQYLLPFFTDNAYIRKDGKPMLVLYRTNDIPNCEEMINYLDRRCKESGLGGLYLVEERNSFQKDFCCSNANAILDFEPMYTLNHDRTIMRRAIDKLESFLFNRATGNHMLIYHYDHIWKRMIRRKQSLVHGRAVFRGAFVDWDNTARKGKNGLVINGASPEKFKKFLSAQICNARAENSEYIFINAWNEWAEGTYLEPDKQNGSAYLDAIRDLMC